MGWRESLALGGKGSFRGEEFFVAAVDSTIGRRTATYEYPGRDKPMVEDLGRRARRFDLTCYVLGSDYMDARDRLRIAFETPGPGPLVHPYWGEMTAVIDGEVTIRESTADGGMASFSLRMVEFGGEEKTPTVKPDTETAVSEEADATVAAAEAEFEEDWTVAGVISDVVEAAVDTVNSVTSTINAVKSRVNAVMNAVDTIGESITALGAAAASIVSLPGQLASTVTGLVADVNGAIDTIGNAWDAYFSENETPGRVAGAPAISASAATPATGFTRVDALMEAFRSFNAYDPPAVEVTSTMYAQQPINQAAMVRLLKMAAVAEACRVAAAAPFVSYDQAVSVRDELTAAIDDLADTAGDVAYAALADLRAAIAKHLIEVAAALPMVTEYTPPKALPALVLSQMIFGDALHEQEILDRNDIRNPASIPVAPLEVIVDG